MHAKKAIFRGFIILAIFIGVNFTYGQQPSDQSRKLIIFYSPACHRCIEAKTKLIPEIEKEFKGQISIEYRDISEIDNYKLMLGLQEKYRSNLKHILPVFFFEGHFLNGEGDIKRGLIWLITHSLNKPQEYVLPQIDLVARFKTLRPIAVISAGLIDGINPCAFTVIVFFISFLAFQGYKKRDLLIIGLSFIFAVFLTYLLLGLGLFNFLYQLKGFSALVRVFNFSVGIFSIILGIFCLYDFAKFKKTRHSEGLILQLPAAVKNQIHKLIGKHYRQVSQRHIIRLVFSALITGFLVSILEAVCTGQVYLPTISFVLKTTPLRLEALTYLFIYNLMFITPLLIIFFLALLGVTSQAFAKILKQQLLAIKIAMALLFFSLGIFLIYRP